MSGYNPNFLAGITLPLPEFTPEIIGEVLIVDQDSNSAILNYPNYSLVMNKNKHRRSLFYSAFNIDQNSFISTERSKKWRLDSRIGAEHQLSNEYYTQNPWDRGHSVRNSTASQGVNAQEAAFNARETFYYTNATLQHENLNQDEWLALEDWVKDLDLDQDGKITEFSGPFYGEFSVSIEPAVGEVAFTPAGYFKIICFINKSGELEVRAFVMYQDERSLLNKDGKAVFNNQAYQVTVAEIEQLTGLRFPAVIADRNPLYFYSSDYTRSNGIRVPERNEVSASIDIISGGPRAVELDEAIDVFISGVMAKPHYGAPQWVSLINFDDREWDIQGWEIGTTKNNRFRIASLDGSAIFVQPGTSWVVELPSDILLRNDKSSVIYLWDNFGQRIDRVSYTKKMVERNMVGKMINLLTPRDILLEV